MFCSKSSSSSLKSQRSWPGSVPSQLAIVPYAIWLVVLTPEKYESHLGRLFPIYGKIKFMFQTTNQLYMWHGVSNNLNSKNTSKCRNRTEGRFRTIQLSKSRTSAWSAERSANPSTSQPQRQDRGQTTPGLAADRSTAWAQDAAGSSKRNIPLPTGRPAQQLKLIWHQKTSDSANCDESWISSERVNSVNV